MANGIPEDPNKKKGAPRSTGAAPQPTKTKAGAAPTPARNPFTRQAPAGGVTAQGPASFATVPAPTQELSDLVPATTRQTPTIGSMAQAQGFMGDTALSNALKDRLFGIADRGDRGATTAALGQGFVGQEQSRGFQEAALANAALAGQIPKMQQQGLIGLLQQGAIGQGPSAAQAQFQSALDQNIAAQAALAGRQRGASATGALRNAARAGEGLALQSQAQSAALRAQEQQAAQALLGGVLGQTRGQDLTRADLLGQQAGAIRGDDQRLIGLGLASRGLDDAAQQNALAQLFGQQELGALGASRFANFGTDNRRIAAGLQTAEEDRAQRERRADEARFDKFFGATTNALGGLLPLLLSDETVKENVKDADSDVQDFLNALKAKRFDYKADAPKGSPKGKQQLGVMAQDLMRSVVGQSLVERGSDGKLRIDIRKGFGAVLASQASLNKRLSALEGK